jgi:N-glycosylase/DNA lyase
VLRRPEVVGNAVVDMEISFKRNALHVRVMPAVEQRALEERLRRMFQLHVDTTEFIELTRRSEPHAWVEDSGFGRLLCGSTLFEDVMKIIATTNTTWRQTVRMVELLVEKCGKRSPEGFFAFPDPADVARFPVDDLQQDCRLGYRAKSIHGLAGGIVRGEVDLARIADPEQSTPDLFKSYLSLPGIGPYGAAHLLAMDGRHDFIAVDSEFRRFVRHRYHRGRAVSDKTMLRRYARWGRWQYLAYWAELWSDYRQTKVL